MMSPAIRCEHKQAAWTAMLGNGVHRINNVVQSSSDQVTAAAKLLTRQSSRRHTLFQQYLQTNWWSGVPLNTVRYTWARLDCTHPSIVANNQSHMPGSTFRTQSMLDRPIGVQSPFQLTYRTQWQHHAPRRLHSCVGGMWPNRITRAPHRHWSSLRPFKSEWPVGVNIGKQHDGLTRSSPVLRWTTPFKGRLHSGVKLNLAKESIDRTDKPTCPLIRQECIFSRKSNYSTKKCEEDGESSQLAWPICLPSSNLPVNRCSTQLAANRINQREWTA